MASNNIFKEYVEAMLASSVNLVDEDEEQNPTTMGAALRQTLIELENCQQANVTSGEVLRAIQARLGDLLVNLNMHLNAYYGLHRPQVSLHELRQQNIAVLNPATGQLEYTSEFLAAIYDAATQNSVRKHKKFSRNLAVGAPVAVFIIVALMMLIYDLATIGALSGAALTAATGWLPFLPLAFVSAFGPIAGVFIFAALVAAAAFVLVGSSMAITALLTHNGVDPKKMASGEQQPAFQQLSSTSSMRSFKHRELSSQDNPPPPVQLKATSQPSSVSAPLTREAALTQQQRRGNPLPSASAHQGSVVMEQQKQSGTPVKLDSTQNMGNKAHEQHQSFENKPQAPQQPHQQRVFSSVPAAVTVKKVDGQEGTPVALPQPPKARGTLSSAGSTPDQHLRRQSPPQNEGLVGDQSKMVVQVTEEEDIVNFSKLPARKDDENGRLAAVARQRKEEQNANPPAAFFQPPAPQDEVPVPAPEVLNNNSAADSARPGSEL